MRVFFIGFGQAGGKIVDMFLAQDRKLQQGSFRGIAVNTARTDLMGLKHIEMKDRLLIGQTVVSIALMMVSISSAAIFAPVTLSVPTP